MFRGRRARRPVVVAPPSRAEWTSTAAVLAAVVAFGTAVGEPQRNVAALYEKLSPTSAQSICNGEIPPEDQGFFPTQPLTAEATGGSGFANLSIPLVQRQESERFVDEFFLQAQKAAWKYRFRLHDTGPAIREISEAESIERVAEIFNREAGNRYGILLKPNEQVAGEGVVNKTLDGADLELFKRFAQRVLMDLRLEPLGSHGRRGVEVRFVDKVEKGYTTSGWVGSVAYVTQEVDLLTGKRKAEIVLTWRREGSLEDKTEQLVGSFRHEMAHVHADVENSCVALVRHLNQVPTFPIAKDEDEEELLSKARRLRVEKGQVLEEYTATGRSELGREVQELIRGDFTHVDLRTLSSEMQSRVGLMAAAMEKQLPGYAQYRWDLRILQRKGGSPRLEEILDPQGATFFRQTIYPERVVFVVDSSNSVVAEVTVHSPRYVLTGLGSGVKQGFAVKTSGNAVAVLRHGVFSDRARISGKYSYFATEGKPILGDKPGERIWHFEANCPWPGYKELPLEVRLNGGKTVKTGISFTVGDPREWGEQGKDPSVSSVPSVPSTSSGLVAPLTPASTSVPEGGISDLAPGGF